MISFDFGPLDNEIARVAEYEALTERVMDAIDAARPLRQDWQVTLLAAALAIDHIAEGAADAVVHARHAMAALARLWDTGQSDS
jgi:hypothetical protein